MTMKSAAAALLLLLAVAAPPRLAAQENAYDVLGKALVPIADIFAPDENGIPVPHGLVLDAHLLSASKLPPALQGQAVHVAIMTPDKLLIQAPIAGQMITACRDQDVLWVSPGSQLQGWLDAFAARPQKKKKRAEDAARVLGPMVLPVSSSALVFLPVLFQVADAGTETIGGTSCRVLDVQLLQQLEKSLHAQGWTARVWIGPDYGIVQIALTGPDWSGTIAIDKLALPALLPDATFQPPAADVLKLTAGEFLGLLGQVGRQGAQ